MFQFFSQLVIDDDQNEFPHETRFWHDNELVPFIGNPADEGQTLNALVFKVRKNPKNLPSHLRRIYFCYRKGLSAQLYAALLDFLIILQGKGKAISRRMIQGSRRQLDQQQLLALNGAVNGHYEKLGNRYSLLTAGRIGRCELVEYQQQAKAEHDFLTLANDFIEYSQLEQAMDVLETGISVSPDRQDLQRALLELYRSTGNRLRFESFYKNFVKSGMPIADEWQVAANYFEGRP